MASHGVLGGALALALILQLAAAQSFDGGVASMQGGIGNLQAKIANAEELSLRKVADLYVPCLRKRAQFPDSAQQEAEACVRTRVAADRPTAEAQAATLLQDLAAFGERAGAQEAECRNMQVPFQRGMCMARTMGPLGGELGMLGGRVGMLGGALGVLVDGSARWCVARAGRAAGLPDRSLDLSGCRQHCNSNGCVVVDELQYGAY